MGDALDAELGEETEGKFRSFLEVALTRTTLESANHAFRERIRMLRDERDDEVQVNLLCPCPPPLQLRTMIVWNSDVHMEVQQLQQQVDSGAGGVAEADDDG